MSLPAPTRPLRCPQFSFTREMAWARLLRRHPTPTTTDTPASLAPLLVAWQQDQWLKRKTAAR